MKSKKTWGILAGVLVGVLVVALAVYLLLDTFVIEKAYAPVASNSVDQTDADVPASTVPPENDEVVEETEPPEETPEEVDAHNAVITDTSYEDDNISITLSEYREYGTNIHVAEVTISSPEYLKTAFAKDTYGQNIKAETSETAERVGAIFAVNGDYYGAREEGYVVRNGVVYRDTSAKKEDLVIYKDGSFAMIKEGTVAAQQLLDDGAEQVLSFGPSLIVNGELSESIASHSENKNPRTAIGLTDDLHYIFVVTDGRTDDSDGLAYSELAEFMLSLGVKEAYNLDGGGSSAMYFNGRTVNAAYHGNEREVSDIVYIGY